MLVRDQMSLKPVTVAPDMSVPDALSLMREKKVRRLPVIDAKGKLVGIVSDKDLLYASPSPTTSLSVWEINYLLGKLTIAKVMTKKVVTVVDDTPIEEAARIMADSKIGGLPVMKDGSMVGIITETDIFRSFVELFGGRRKGVRVSVLVTGGKGVFAKVTGAISAAGGDIVGLGVSEVDQEGQGSWKMTLRVMDIKSDRLVEALTPVVIKVVDIREV